jgi:protocatechuate 3,4-dioxygenase beta subunit
LRDKASVLGDSARQSKIQIRLLFFIAAARRCSYNGKHCDYNKFSKAMHRFSPFFSDYEISLYTPLSHLFFGYKGENLKRSHNFRRVFAHLALALSIFAVIASTAEVAQASTGTATGTITAGGVPVPKGTVQIAFVQYPIGSGCNNFPTGQLEVAMVGNNGTFSQALDTRFPWKIIYRPLSSAPRTALWRLYKSGTIGGVTRFAPDATCLTLTASGVTNIDLSTTESGVRVSGSLSTSTGAPVTEKATIYLSRTATSYLATGDGYVVRVGENGTWDISGVDQNQSNLYLQVNLNGTFFSVKKVDNQYQVIPLDATCGDACKFAVSSSDISGVQLTLPQVGSITGTISGPSGPVGAGQVCAIAYKDGGSAMNMYSLEAARACTNSSGEYTLGLIFGSYRVQFVNMPGAPYKSEWYDQIANGLGYSGATVVSLAAGATATKTISPTLAEGKYIRGRITDASGAPVPGAGVTAVFLNPETSMPMGGTGINTTTDGTYTIWGLEPGTYTLSTFHSDHGTSFLGGSRDSLTQIVISSSSPGVSGQDISFPRGYAISGTLSTGDGSEGRVCAAAYKSNESDMGWGDFITSNCFMAPGPWRLKGLTTGTYRIRFDAQSGNLRSVFLGGVTDYNSAATQSITTADINNVDVTIPAGKSISGTIMNTVPAIIQGACVTAFKQNGQDGFWGSTWAGGSCTTVAGEFSIRGLEDGEYKLRIEPPMNSDYGPGYFTESGNPSKSADDAQVFTIGSSISNLSQILLTGPKFTATVKDGSTPVAGVCITAYKKVNNYGWGDWGGSSCSGVDGKVNIRGLVSGDYTFEVRPNVGNYQNGWYVQSATTSQSKSDATLKTLATTDISLGDVSLSAGKKATGRIVNSSGDGVTGICIGALKESTNGWGEWAGSTCTSSDGRFTLKGLDPAASYRFRVDVWASDYKPGFINASNGVSADIGSIAPRPADIDIDLGEVTLSRGPSISGIITSGTDQPESNVCITAHDAETLSWKTSTCTQSNGKFSLRGLDAGTYKLSWWTQKALLTNGWYKTTGSGPTQVVSPEGAEILTLTSSGLSNISVRLANGGKIYGVIEGSTSSEICVAAWTSDSTISGSRENATAISCVNSEMRFELKGLTPNTNYYLQVFRKDSGAISQDTPDTDTAIQSGGAAVTISVT